MIGLHLANYTKHCEGVTLDKPLILPMSDDSLLNALKLIGVTGENNNEYFIPSYKSDYKHITGSFGERENLWALNALAQEMAGLDDFERDKLDAACVLHKCKDAVDMLNLSVNLDKYEYVPAENNEALGEFVVDCDRWKIPVEISEIRNYIDYEKLGHDMQAEQGGIFEGLGYIYDNKREFVEKYKLEDFQEIQNSSNLTEKALEENVATDTTSLTHREKDSLLSKRANLEYESYLEQVKLLPLEKIVDEAYKISTMYDILIQIENNDLPEPDIDALLSLERPVSSVYYEWLDADLNIGDFLSSTIKDVINIQKEEAANDKADTQELRGGNEDENEDEPEFD